MYNSLKSLKNHFSENTVIMPGHNYSVKRQSTIKEEIEGNPFFSFNNLNDFINIECMIMTKLEKSHMVQLLGLDDLILDLILWISFLTRLCQ